MDLVLVVGILAGGAVVSALVGALLEAHFAVQLERLRDCERKEEAGRCET